MFTDDSKRVQLDYLSPTALERQSYEKRLAASSVSIIDNLFQGTALYTTAG